MKRMYHPSLNTFVDVQDGDVEDWAKAGWRKTAPKHFTAEPDFKPGEGPGVAAAFNERVPVLEDVRATRTTTSSPAGSSTTTATGTAPTA